MVPICMNQIMITTVKVHSKNEKALSVAVHTTFLKMNPTQIWMLYMQQVPWKNHQKWSKKHHTEQTPYSLSSTLSKRISKSKHQSNIYRADRKIRMENVTERCIVRFQFELCIGSAYMQENRSPTRSRPPCTKLKK